MKHLETLRTAWDNDSRQARQQSPMPTDRLTRILLQPPRQPLAPTLPPLPQPRKASPLRYAATLLLLLACSATAYAAAPAPAVKAINASSLLRHAETTAILTQTLSRQ